MQKLTELLWGVTKAGSARKMQGADFELRCAKWKCLEVVQVDDKRMPPHVGQNPNGAEEGTEEPIVRERGVNGKESNLSDRTSPNDEQSSEDSGVSSSHLPQTSSSPQGNDGVMAISP